MNGIVTQEAQDIRETGFKELPKGDDENEQMRTSGCLP